MYFISYIVPLLDENTKSVTPGVSVILCCAIEQDQLYSDLMITKGTNKWAMNEQMNIRGKRKSQISEETFP